MIRIESFINPTNIEYNMNRFKILNEFIHFHIEKSESMQNIKMNELNRNAAVNWVRETFWLRWMLYVFQVKYLSLCS